MIANRDALGAWEKFVYVDLGNGRCAFQSRNNGQYICAEDGENQPLIANRGAVGAW